MHKFPSKKQVDIKEFRKYDELSQKIDEKIIKN